jgi:hypothetical protein
MKTWKWRIGLSVVNLLLAIGMSALGAGQWEADGRLHPEYFYHGNLYYCPTAQWLSYCLNAPSLAVVNVIGDFTIRYHLLPQSLLGAYLFYFVRPEFYVAIFLFWAWAGWHVDVGLPSRDCHTRWATALEVLIGILLSITLLYQGIPGLLRQGVMHAIPASMVLWGIVLLLYSVGGIRRMSARRTDGSPTPNRAAP